MKQPQRAEAHFAQFVESATDSLLSTAFLLTRDRQAAEELVQDSLVALYPKWPRVQAADSAAGLRPALPGQPVPQPAPQQGRQRAGDRPGAGTAAARRLRSDCWPTATSCGRRWAGLPARQRAAVVLRYFHDYSDQQCADAMDCRIGTVRSLISRALATLRGDPAFTDTDQHSRHTQEVCDDREPTERTRGRDPRRTARARPGRRRPARRPRRACCARSEGLPMERSPARCGAGWCRCWPPPRWCWSRSA